MNPSENTGGLPQVVLPNADDAPAILAKSPGHETVAGVIAGELLHPKGAVAGRHVGVLRAAVTKAAVHENGDALLAEDKVGPAEDRLVTTPVGDALGAKQSCERKFRGLVSTAADAGHDFGTPRLGENVRHGNQTAKWSVKSQGVVRMGSARPAPMRSLQA